MQEDIDFKRFAGGFDFVAYPFTSFTAEDEKERQPELFISTKLYSPLLDSFLAGSAMLLSGDRGTGKTSITYDFIRRVNKNDLVCHISDFSRLAEKYRQADFYRFVLTHMVNTFFSSIESIGSVRQRLSEDEILLLTYFYVNFADDSARGLVKRVARDLQQSRAKQRLIKLYNFFRNPLNVFLNVGVSVASEVVARSAGVKSEISAQVAEYFPEIIAGLETEFPSPENTFEALTRFSGLALKAGYRRLILVLDKIDEDQRLENAAENIADFISPMLTDNKFLLHQNFQVVFSLWVVPLNFIKSQVRTQKINSPEISWEHSDLKQAFNRRTKVFSKSGGRSFDEVFDSTVDDAMKAAILDLCNRNPRDLWHLMDKIFRAQYRLDESAKFICAAAVDSGMVDFVRTFNFYEYYPRKANARANSMDVYAYIKHLLKLDSPVFTRNQLNEMAGTGSSTQNYTVGMENLGLIEKQASEKGEANYRIRDPKVRFALSRQIEIQKA